MAKAAFRIAVLQCDTPVHAVHVQRGSYGQIFEDLLSQSLNLIERRDISFEVTKWDVVNSRNYPDIASGAIDAILITGSKYTAFHDDDWITALVTYVKRVLAESTISVIGICFGHQIIGRALGAQIGVSPGGWEISTCQIKLSELGSKILGTNDIVLHQMHRDAVLSLPEGAFNLGTSESCNIQGLVIPRRAISVQAHPEFDEFIMGNVIETRRAQKVFDDNMAEDGLARTKHAHDGVQVFAGLLGYVLAF